MKQMMMSQIEKTAKTTIKLSVAGILSLLPSMASAAIPMRFFPAYTFTISRAEAAPIGRSVIRMKPAKRGIASISTNSNSKSIITRVPSSINRAAITVSTPSKVFYGENGQALSPELIANFYQIKATEKPLDMAELIPMDMQPSNNSTQVFTRVADRSLTTFLKSEAVRESTLGQTATAVQQKMKQEVVLGDGSGDPKAVQHKLNFNLQAFQAMAQVEYSGLTNAALKYKIAENKIALEVFEKISNNKDFVVSHSVSSADRISEVAFRWVF
jgi:hypothetical protein